MHIENKRLLAHESIYWININADLDNAIKNCCHFHNTKHFLHIVDYHSKRPVIKQVKGLSAEYLIKNIFYAEYTLPNRLRWDAGTNFVSEDF